MFKNPSDKINTTSGRKGGEKMKRFVLLIMAVVLSVGFITSSGLAFADPGDRAEARAAAAEAKAAATEAKEAAIEAKIQAAQAKAEACHYCPESYEPAIMKGELQFGKYIFNDGSISNMREWDGEKWIYWYN